MEYVGFSYVCSTSLRVYNLTIGPNGKRFIAYMHSWQVLNECLKVLRKNHSQISFTHSKVKRMGIIHSKYAIKGWFKQIFIHKLNNFKGIYIL